MPLTVLVVGAGPGGVAAAVQLRRLGVPVRWLDKTGVPGGLLVNAQRVENWPGMPVGASGPECCARLRAHAAAFDLAPEGAEVLGFSEDADGVEVRCVGGMTVRAAAVVWAIGTAPLPWALARPELPVVYDFVDLPQDARRVLVIGGGEAACDGALHWVEAGGHGILAVRAARLRARGRLAGRTLASELLDLRFSTEVVFVESSGERVRCRLRTGVTETVELVDAVLFCGGRVSGLSGLGLPAPLPGRLRVTPRMWAVGDARLGGLGQACIAMGDGLLAAAEVVELIRWD